MVAAHPPRLARALEAARSAGASLAVIDMAPREAGGAVEAARCSDLVLVPCRPSAVDLAAIPASLDVSRLAETTAAVVLNAVPPRGDLAAQATESRPRLRGGGGSGNSRAHGWRTSGHLRPGGRPKRPNPDPWQQPRSKPCTNGP